MKAQDVFETNNITIAETSDARKEKIADEDAWKLITSAEEVVVGRGKKFTVFTPSEEDKEVILKQSLGRTGNLRAPALKIDNKLIIGFSDEMYSTYIG